VIVANLLLGVSGSVAAIKTPQLYDALIAAGHTVTVIPTSKARYFFDPQSLAPNSSGPAVVEDADEWPGLRYERDQPIPHIELRRWADGLLVAPLSANCLAKLAVGICDNLLTSIWRAWDFSRPVMFAPAMNTLMWQHPYTRRHLRSIAADFGAGHIPAHLGDEDLIRQINERSKTLRVIAPICKTLACGDVGVGAMAEIADIVRAVQEWITPVGSRPPGL
jgi:phosphopantothenoylcysteine decarboxylase